MYNTYFFLNKGRCVYFLYITSTITHRLGTWRKNFQVSQNKRKVKQLFRTLVLIICILFVYMYTYVYCRHIEVGYSFGLSLCIQL